MIGLFIAALYVGLSVLKGTLIAMAVIGALNFMWYWYLTFAVITVLVCGGLFVFGLLMAVDKSNKDMNGGMIMLASPILLITAMLRYVLVLTGISLVLIASQTHPLNIVEWDTTKAIVGIILFLIGMFVFRMKLKAEDFKLTK